MSLTTASGVALESSTLPAPSPDDHRPDVDLPNVNLYVGDGAFDQPRNRHRLRVGLNLFPLALRGGGMRQYVMQLLPLLIRRTDHEFVLFHGLSARASVGAILRDLTPDERARVRLRFIDHPHAIYGQASTFDVYFCPLNGFEPQLLDRPTLATLADVQERFFPQYFSPEELKSRGIVYPRVIHSVTSLITISEFSKQTICDEFDADPNRIHVTHLAPNYGMLGAASQWPDSLPPLPARYVVYPANTYPHKNHALLIEAVGLLKQSGRLSFKCLLTGHHLGQDDPLSKLIASYELEDDVIWLGHVPSGALRCLYENALALAFPSEFEGFGMPLVEAMYCGCPIVANRAASIPEICGDAALFIPPEPVQWADALASLVDDEARLHDLVEKGRRQAERFTVEKLADETIERIDDAVDTFRQQMETTSANAVTGSSTAVTYVIISRNSNRSLEHTLNGLAFTIGEDDRILVVADAAKFDDRVTLLIENFEQVEVVAPDADWSARLKSEYAMTLRAGTALVEGGAQAACNVLAADPSRRLVIGEVLHAHPDGTYIGLAYTRFHAGLSVPLEAVVWKRDELLRHRETISKLQPLENILETIPPDDVLHLSRTVATQAVGLNGRLKPSFRRRNYLRLRKFVGTIVRKFM